jgi:WD40 repeat protein/serine/threonine protein kinase
MAGAVDGDSLPMFGPYRIQELLGQGGMGVVHRAYDTVHQRVIALKRLPATVTDRGFLARFRRESRIVANLSHPNVIPVNDFGEIDGQLYLDMMLVEGTDLRRAIGKGTITQERAIAILTQVAAALDVAHESGLVHRDVKPSNILLTNDDHAYLADFGIARTTAPDATELTRSGDVVGSWDYMAPERLSRGQVDGRADQYSLACVLFECLTGRLPHPAVDPAAKVAAHLLQPPPAPSVFVPTISQALDEAVLKGMAKDPARRYSTATDLMVAAAPPIDAEETVKAARTTLVGPLKERDQAKLIRAIVRSTDGRKPPTLPIPHDYPPTCPYPGLRGFDRDDSIWFHGRGQVVTELLVRMAEQLDRGEPVVLVGASGAGKSSVVHAGLLPTLAGEEKAWPQLVITPGADPVGHLATAVAAHTGGNPAELARSIRDHPDRFGALTTRVAKGEPVRPVIVVDQFEELFTHPIAETDRIAFATALVNAAPALTLLAVRADLVERCIGLVALMPALTAPVLLGPMSDIQLREAIVAPARDASLEVEPSLVERLITDLGMRGDTGYDPGALPRLAHALRETWNHRDGATLTLAAYRRAGGIDGAVSRTAEEIYARLDPGGRDALRVTMLRLVAVLDDGAVARRRVDPRELSAHQVTLDQLILARLVTVDATGARLAHEALLTAWPRLHDWIDEDRAGLIQHRRFGDAVRAWADSGRHDDDLYRGVRLTTLTAWLHTARDRIRLQPAEQEFLTRSNALEQASAVTARRRTRRLRGLVAALSLLLVVASIAVLVALLSRQDAQEQRTAADAAGRLSVSRQLAAESALTRAIDPRRAALLALGAWRAGSTVEARSALLSSAIDAYRGRMTTGHDGAVTSVAVSGDGKVAATGGRDGTLRLWDVPQRREIAKLEEGGGWFRTVSMSTDGRLLVAASVDKNTVKLWSVPDRKVLYTVTDAIDATIAPDGNRFAVTTGRGIAVFDTDRFTEQARFPVGVTLRLAFSQDASLLATTNDKNVVVYRVSDGATVANLTGHDDRVTSVIFNRTGSLLASTGEGATLRLWETKGWTTARTLTGAAGGLHAAVFSPNGRLLVAAGTGKALPAWDPETGNQLGVYVTGGGSFGVAMTADGHTLLSTGADGLVTEWGVDRYGMGYEDAAVLGVAFQPDGDLVALSTPGGSVQLWDRTTGSEARRLTGHTGDVSDVAFSPDGKRLASVSGDGQLMLWDPASGRRLAALTRDGTALGNVAFSPDGKTVAVAGHTPVGSDADHDELLLLSATDLAVVARRPTRLEPRNDTRDASKFNYPSGVAFSPDGRLLAAPLSGGKIILWNLVDPGAASSILPGHSGAAIDAAFSPDGTLLVTGGDDRRVRLWRVRDGSQIAEFGHDAPVRNVAFSPDGKTLATASVDTLVRLWEVPSGTLIARLDRQGDEVNKVAFDGTGSVLASAGSDGRVILWQLDTDRAARMLCDALDRVTMVNEWLSLGPDRGAPPSCPS